MKKTKLVLAALTLISSLAFANFKDVPKTHWSYQAVTDLYNKGLLAPTVTDSEAFKGDGVFSRYEIASMLYYNVVYMNEKLDEKASAGDVIALKALVADFAPELEKMGANIGEMEGNLDGKLAKLEKKINKKIKTLQDRVGKVKVAGEMTAEMKVGMKDNAPGMVDGLELEGDISIVGNVNKNVSAVTKFSVEEGEDMEVTAMEIKAKSPNFNITFFRDQDKDPEGLLVFTNNLSLFNGNAVAPKEGIVFNGKKDLSLAKLNYLGMFFPTSAGDFYGMQMKSDFGIMGSYLRFSYTEKVVNYLYDEGTKETADNARALYSVDAGVNFKPLPFWKTQVKGEFATRRSPGIENIDSDENEAEVESRDAVYLYTANTFKMGYLGTVKANIGYYNAGEYFDIAGLGLNSTKVFSESGLATMEADKKAYMAKASYDLFSKGFLIADALYASYGSNVADEYAEEEMEGKLILNLVPGKVKIEGIYRLEKDEVEADQIYDGESEEDGLESLESRLKLNVIRGAEQNFRLALIDDKDEPNGSDTENKMEFYFDNVMTFGIFELKMGLLYEFLGLDLDTEVEKVYGESGALEAQLEPEDSNEENNLDVGMALDIRTENTTFTIGARYNYEDTKGHDVIPDVMLEEGVIIPGFDDTRKTDDTEGYSLSLSHEIKAGNLTLTYGGKYEEELEYVDGKSDLEDVDEDDDLVYAIGVEYDFGDDVVASFTYGDPDFSTFDDMTEENFVLRRTAFAEGEQDQMILTIEAKF